MKDIEQEARECYPDRKEAIRPKLTFEESEITFMKRMAYIAGRTKSEERIQILETLHEQHRMYGGYDDLIKALEELTKDIDAHKVVIRKRNSEIIELKNQLKTLRNSTIDLCIAKVKDDGIAHLESQHQWQYFENLLNALKTTE